VLFILIRRHENFALPSPDLNVHSSAGSTGGRHVAWRPPNRKGQNCMFAQHVGLGLIETTYAEFRVVVIGAGLCYSLFGYGFLLVNM